MTQSDIQNNWSSRARELLTDRQYGKAIEIINDELSHNPDDSEALVLSGRCFLALNQLEQASTAYRNVLSSVVEPPVLAIAEAKLILGDVQSALKHYETALREDGSQKEARFLASTAAYKEGFIYHAREYLKQAIQLGFEWEDDDPLDFVVQYLMTTPEFSDFELIYLDVGEEVELGAATARNRWFSLNLPIYDLFIASDSKKQEERATALAKLMAAEFDDSFFTKGAQGLERILRDFANSDVDARFGLEACKQLKEKNWSQVASLILGLELEHLKEFAGHFGLDAKWIDNLQLQNLIPLLPQRMAIGLMFLYAASEPKDLLQNMNTHQIDDRILTSLMAASFINFYREIDRYRKSAKSPPKP